MVKYKEQREKPSYWEVIDVEQAHVFYCESQSEADFYRLAVETMGHRAIVKEVTRK